MDEEAMTLRECVYNEFKDEHVAADIYQKLQEMDIADLHTLQTIDEDDMNHLCKEMGLNDIKKIKFKSLIRKQKEIKNYNNKQIFNQILLLYKNMLKLIKLNNTHKIQ